MAYLVRKALLVAKILKYFNFKLKIGNPTPIIKDNNIINNK